MTTKKNQCKNYKKWKFKIEANKISKNKQTNS